MWARTNSGKLPFEQQKLKLSDCYKDVIKNNFTHIKN